MFGVLSSAGRTSKLYCGFVRERGTVRTSTTKSTPASCRIPTNSARLRVEWPIVNSLASSDVGQLHLHFIDEQGFDVGDGPAAHFLVHCADQALLDFLVETFLEDSERFWRSDNRERVEVI